MSIVAEGIASEKLFIKSYSIESCITKEGFGTDQRVPGEEVFVCVEDITEMDIDIQLLNLRIGRGMGGVFRASVFLYLK